MSYRYGRFKREKKTVYVVIMTSRTGSYSM